MKRFSSVFMLGIVVLLIAAVAVLGFIGFSNTGYLIEDGQRWTKTELLTADDFTNGFEKKLDDEERLRFMVEGELYHVGAIEIFRADGIATLDISSIGKVNFSVGAVERFDVNGDNYYDVEVTLKNVNAGKAHVRLLKISEFVGEQDTLVQNGIEDSVEDLDNSQRDGISGRIIIILVVLVLVVIVSIRKIYNNSLNPMKLMKVM